MSNFRISFSHPWLLFLLLAAVLLTLIPHLRISKKYRRNRNRIVSLVLHLIVLTLSILVLAGIRFDYTLKNTQNEIILLVDVSDSKKEVEDERDDVIDTILEAGKFDGYKIGVVTFGFDQQYAVPLTTDTGSIYSKYKSADLPDTSATDIAAALTYTKSLFNYPETSKIVLITDGKETDESALSTIRSISASGTKVDICYINSDSNSEDLQIFDVVDPDTHISLDTDVEFKFKVKSNVSKTVDVAIFDKGIEKNIVQLNLVPGIGEYTITTKFTEYGVHELKFSLKNVNDAIEENNIYSTYINIESFNQILIIEGNDDETSNDSELLKSTLEKDGEFNVTVLNTHRDVLPKTVDELRQYDQVILNNVADADLPTNIVQGSEKQVDFIDILWEYVEDYGGGLLTTAGLNSDGEAHAYNRDDLRNTKLQSMLPVQAINYTPPLGIMIVIDTSGSMTSPIGDGSGKTYLQAAIDSAQTTLDSLSERDMVGVMTLADYEDQTVLLGLTPRTQEDKIRAAINLLEEKDDLGGGTSFYPAIRQAASLLKAQTNLAKKHIIIVSDGGAGDSEGDSGYKTYAELANEEFIKNGITTSIVVVGNSCSDDDMKSIEYATKGPDGTNGGNYYTVTRNDELTAALRADLNVGEIKDVEEGNFTATANNFNYSSIFKNVNLEEQSDYSYKLDFEFSGFTGTKVKSNDYLVLSGDYSVPIYAQWKFGNGTVGSLMIDLTGKWSSELFSSQSGVSLLKNIINEVMPTENIHASEIRLNLRSDNYINQMSIYTDLNEGEKLTGKISYIDSNGEEKTILMDKLPNDTDNLKLDECYVTTAMSLSNNFSRCNFVIKESGLYQIEVNKVDSQGNIIATEVVYKELSYSKEYDSNLLGEDFNMEDYLKNLADRGKGELIEDNEDPQEIFKSFVSDINKSYDPRILFMIIAVVLFLTDIVVRKFKFKWPHELIRDYKKKKEINK